MGIFLKLNNLDQFPGLILRVGDYGDVIEISKHFEPSVSTPAPPPVGNVGSGDISEHAAHFRRLQSAVRFDETNAALKIEEVEPTSTVPVKPTTASRQIPVGVTISKTPINPSST